jgi:hypothetical protein
MGYLKLISLWMGGYLNEARLWSESKRAPKLISIIHKIRNTSTGFPRIFLNPYKSTFRYHMLALSLIGLSTMMKPLVAASLVDKATSTSIHSFKSKRALPSLAVI